MLSNKVIRQLQMAHGWSQEFIDALTPYYVATLTHISRGQTPPVFQIIDQIWHAHILNTREYADFCAARFGRFIHHEQIDENHIEDGADPDFFRNYGLSLQCLAAICAADRNRIELQQARCGSGNPPTHAKPGLPPGEAVTPMSLARCGEPTPPTISAGQALTFVRCGEPDQPVPPEPSGPGVNAN